MKFSVLAILIWILFEIGSVIWDDSIPEYSNEPRVDTRLSEKTLLNIKFLEKIEERVLIVFYPVDFSVYSPPVGEVEDSLDSWFGSNRWSRDGDVFIQFGRDSTGSEFSFWFYPALQGEPPVVFLGSEGDLFIVSNNSTDFVKQITSGMSYVGGEWLEFDEEAKKAIDLKLLKSMAQQYLGSVRISPAELTKIAQKNHPDFKKWAKSKIDY